MPKNDQQAHYSLEGIEGVEIFCRVVNSFDGVDRCGGWFRRRSSQEYIGALRLRIQLLLLHYWRLLVPCDLVYGD